MLQWVSMNNDTTNQTEENTVEVGAEISAENLGTVSEVSATTAADTDVQDILPSTEVADISLEVVPEVTEAVDQEETPTV